MPTKYDGARDVLVLGCQCDEEQINRLRNSELDDMMDLYGYYWEQAENAWKPKSERQPHVHNYWELSRQQQEELRLELEEVRKARMAEKAAQTRAEKERKRAIKNV
jgi:hypothetical protein